MLDVDVDYLFFPFDSSVLNTFCVEKCTRSRHELRLQSYCIKIMFENWQEIIEIIGSFKI